MKSIRSWLPKALFESFLIVFSILLALAVNEWHDNRARLERAAQARTAFLNEIRANRDLLASERILPYHKILQAEYQRLADENSVEEGGLFRTGVHPAALRDAAWRSFSTSGTLADFAPADVILLSDIYRAQSDLSQTNADYLSAMRTARSDRELPEYRRDLNRSLMMFLNDIVSMEEDIATIYEKALRQLGAK